MDDAFIWVLLIGAGLAAFALSANASPLLDAGGNVVTDSNGNPIITGADQSQGIDMSASWKVGEYPQYAAAIQAAEIKYSLPADLLSRVLFQESHYRADIISGSTKSSAGAIGIAQFMPRTAADLGINPLDPFASIDAAALYLSRLHREFGSWSGALGAYNFGAGNYIKYEQGRVQLPAETVAYISDITGDVQVV